MRIYLINPNTTASMTAKAELAARTVVHAETTIIGVQPSVGPASIEGYYDEAFCLPGLLEEMQKAEQADGFVIACFDDTGLDAARCMTDKPVVGIGEAAYHFASMLGHKFGVVTTLARSVAALEHNLAKYGLDTRCSGVRASEIPVLELEKKEPAAMAAISAQIEACIKEDGAEAIVLGCAGMTDLALSLQDQHGVPVIDGVVCAAKQVESMVTLGMKTSTKRTYAPPSAKAYSGYLSRFEPSA